VEGGWMEGGWKVEGMEVEGERKNDINFFSDNFRYSI
jgi:hypothetical protein